jgi:hypothetical protein
MKQQQLSTKMSFSFKSFLLLIGVIIILPMSCKIALIAPYDAGIKTQIIDAQKKIDYLYITLSETKESERTYQNFATAYIDVEVALTSILRQNQVKPLNEHATAVTKIALNFWKKYKNEHKAENTISNGMIKINSKYMSDIMYAMQVSEEGKKLAETNKEIIKE